VNRAPFTAEDLRELDERLLSKADYVVQMREAVVPYQGLLGLRHDVDNTFEPCVQLAEWEAERGYHATYYILHDSPYWNTPELRPGLERIADLGHEIGLHTNAIAVALQTGRCPHEIVAGALDRLRYWGHDVVGVVAHGDPQIADDGRRRGAGDEIDHEFPEVEIVALEHRRPGLGQAIEHRIREYIADARGADLEQRHDSPQLARLEAPVDRRRRARGSGRRTCRTCRTCRRRARARDRGRGRGDARVDLRGVHDLKNDSRLSAPAAAGVFVSPPLPLASRLRSAATASGDFTIV